MANTDTLAQAHTSTAEIERIFQLQKEHQFEVARSTAKERIRKLNRLLNAIMRYRPQINGGGIRRL